MQHSLLRKLLQKISPKQDPKVKKSLAEISEQGRASDMEEMNISTAPAAEEIAYEAESAERTVDNDLAELRERFPELSELESITELNNPTRYAALRDLGLSSEEAYLATRGRVAPPDNRAHLTSSVPTAAKIPASGMSKAQMEEARELFGDLSDTEIQKLYQKVTK